MTRQPTRIIDANGRDITARLAADHATPSAAYSSASESTLLDAGGLKSVITESPSTLACTTSRYLQLVPVMLLRSSFVATSPV